MFGLTPATRILKELKPDHETRVIPISAKEESDAKSLGMAACDFISKPFDVNYLTK
jgi:DNA-binding response OmpR family regulator